MAEQAGIGVASATLPLATGTLLQWDGSSSIFQDVGPTLVPAPVRLSVFQAKRPLAIAPRANSYLTTDEIRLVPLVLPERIAWEQEAARVTFSLDAVLFAAVSHGVVPEARGELVWVLGREPTDSALASVHPALRVHTAYESLQAEHVTVAPSLAVHDPLLRHIALVLQVALQGEGVAEQLYAKTVADALVVHFLSRYAASRPALGLVTGGLAPSKLRRTTAYIQEHLEHDLSLVTLAAVGQTSPAHFARLFKHATGLAPHQYVITCRMEHAKRLLAETDLPLIEVGAQVGCADQSHFTALFRKHVALTPKAYRDSTRSECFTAG
jgi:AraC-like DNA-binding protein